MKVLSWRSEAQAPRYLLAGIALCMALAFWWLHPNLAMDADSPRYLAGSPMRTATYPLFLDAFYGRALLPIQLLLFGAALSWLAFYSSRLLPLIVSAALVLAVGSNPYVWELQATVMSEALTTPLLALIVGCILGFTVTRRRELLIATALICGIATTIRPPLIGLALTPFCAAWITAPKLRDRFRFLAILVLVWAAPVAAERLYSRAIHGRELSSPLGRNTFMKAAVIDAPATTVNSQNPLDRRLVHALNYDFEPVRRLIHRAPDRDVRWILLTNYEACAGYPCANRIVEGFHMSESEIHRHLFRVGVARLESSPLAYLELAASEYPRMWLLHQRKHPDIAPKYNAFLAREAPIPFQAELGEVGQPTPAAEQRGVLRVSRAAFAGIGIIAAIMTMGLAVWRRGPLAQAALCLLLGTQAVLILSTFFGVGLPRYAMGLWPTLIAGELLGMVSVVMPLEERRPTEPRKRRSRV